MRWAVFIIAVSMTACSYTPVVDLRASKSEAQLYQRDLMECRSLARQVDYPIFPTYMIAVNRCLEGRGHSVLNNNGKQFY